MIRVNTLKADLLAGRPVIGIWSIIPSPIIAEIIGIAGMDFLILDMEHGVYDLQTLDNSIRACEWANCAPLVRVPSADQASIQSALDLGAHGIIVPQILDYETALAAVSCMKYPSTGTRGFNPFTRAGDYCNPSNVTSTKLSNDFGLSCVIIENTRAYEQLDAIVSISALDMIYLGVYDMSVSLGCPGDMSNKQLNDFVETSVSKIRNKGKAVGLMVKNDTEIRRYLDMGANFLVYGVDTYLIQSTLSQVVSNFQLAQHEVLGVEYPPHA